MELVLFKYFRIKTGKKYTSKTLLTEKFKKISRLFKGLFI